MHAVCLFAIQATKGLCSSKACSALTDHARKHFVLLAEHIPIDIKHVSAHQGDKGNEFADLLASMTRTCVASLSPSEWPRRRWKDFGPFLFLCVSSQEACHRCHRHCSVSVVVWVRLHKTFVYSMQTRSGLWSHFRSMVAHLLQQFFLLRTGTMVKIQFPFGGKKLWPYSSAVRSRPCEFCVAHLLETWRAFLQH